MLYELYCIQITLGKFIRYMPLKYIVFIMISLVIYEYPKHGAMELLAVLSSLEKAAMNISMKH